MSDFLFYVCGSSGQVRTFDGTDWESLTSGTANTLRGVWGSARDNVLFGGDNGVVKQLDGGTFSTISTPNTRDIVGISGSSSNEMYAIANNINNGDSELWLYSGASFALLETLNRRSYAIHVTASGEVYIGNGAFLDVYSGIGYYSGGAYVDDINNELKDSIYWPDITGVFSDGSGNLFCCKTGPANNNYAWYGSYDNWSLSDVGIGGWRHNAYCGNNMWCDSNGNAFYITSTGTNSPIIIRQKNSGGTWFTAHQTAWNISGDANGGIFGTRCGKILAVATANISGAKPYYIYFDGVSWSSGLIPGTVFNPFGVWAYSPNVSTYRKSTSKNKKYSIALGVDGTISLDDNNDLDVDDTIVSRVIFRLKCKLGEYWADKTIGSRLHTIKIMKDAKRKAELYVIEALQPLIDEGYLTKVSVPEIQTDQPRGAIFARVIIDLPSDNQVDLGFIQIGI